MGKGFPFGLTIVTAVALAILIGLGGWQLKRLAWKQDLLARLSALEAAPPQPLTEALAKTDAAFTRVEVACPGIATAPFIEIHSMMGAEVGSRLVSACPLAGGAYDAVLVDRGFVGEAISARPPVAGPPAPVRVAGVLRPPEKPNAFTPPPGGNRWFSRDLGGIAKALGIARPAPYFLMAETSTNPEWAALRPAPTPNETPNNHLQYALTWFGLAGALGCVYAAMLQRRFKAR